MVKAKSRTAGLLVSLLVASGATGADADWPARIEERIAGLEYHVSFGSATYLDDVEKAWQAPNRAQGFRTYFLEDGIRLVPRTGDATDWELRLSLAGWGREDHRNDAVVSRSPRTTANRVEYDRGGLVEWFVNDPSGLEHGFTVPRPPGKPSAGDPLRIDLELAGTLSPRVRADGQTVDFHGTRRRVLLRYAKLRVVDATGSPVPARMEGLAEAGLRGLRIVVDDSLAVYPLEIDPLMAAASWMVDGGQAGADFGISLSTAGDVNGDGYSDVVVGAPLYDNGESDEGRAFVYHGSASGLSTTPAWTDESDQVNARFGFAVSTAGDVNGDGYSDLAVGCHQCDGGSADTGRVAVYHGSATGLPATPSWSYDNVPTEERLGHSVAAAGDIDGDGFGDLVAGAPFAILSGQPDVGRAYVFHGSSLGLTSTPTTLDGAEPGGQFGFAVAGAGDIDGDTFADIAVGAPFEDGSAVDEGRVHVFYGDVPGSSGQTTLAATSQAGAAFGAAVQTAGDVDGDGFADLLIGAPDADGGAGIVDSGRAYVFHGSAAGIATAAQRTFSGAAGDRLGDSVSTAGDVNGDGYADVILGAPGAESGQADEGLAYVYFGSAAGLDMLVWTGEPNESGAAFGSAVATAGDIDGDGYADVLVGAHRHPDSGGTTAGAVFAYRGYSAGLTESPRWQAEGDAAGDEFGRRVATAGDVNGDRYADVIVGAPGYDAGFSNEGRVFVFHGSATGPSSSPAWTRDGGQTGAGFGFFVASAGDVDNDGYSDVVVGAPHYDTAAGVDAGLARVYHGSVTGLDVFPAWVMEGTQAGAELGREVAGTGDVDGDGFGDLIVGEPRYDTANPSAGRAHLFRGSAAGLATTAAWVDAGDVADRRFGLSVAPAGDVNGDGFSDVLIGSWGGVHPGEAYAYHGSAAGLAGQPSWVVSHGPGADYWGDVVDTAGDVNGDGYADVFAGCTSQPAICPGLFVYHGSPTGLSPGPDWQAPLGSQAASDAGTAGDVNGDGYADLAVDGYVWYGSATGLSPTGHDWGPGAGAGGTAGDVDGDGYADLVLGEPAYESAGVAVGRALVYLGNRGDESDGHGVAVRPQQRRYDDSAPVANLGESDDATRFKLRMAVKTPFGRARGRMDKEVKPLGQPFDGTNTQAPAVYGDTNFGGFTVNVTGLDPDTVYHWRVRVEYDPVTVPLAPHGRWLTVPWTGWQEADLRTAAVAGADAGVVPDDPGSQLTAARNPDGSLRLAWGGSCNANDDDYAVYVGRLGDFTSHVPDACSTGGATEYVYVPPDGVDEYFIVVPINTASEREGSFGTDSFERARSRGPEPCLSQALAACAQTAP